jgi:uncharacterized Zn-binding protein involved in type VI secretion
MPPAARVGDMHICPMVTPGLPPIPHVGGPILPPGAPTVLIGGMPAARMSDMAVCVGPPDVILMGSPTVLIGGMMAARIGDPTAHGGVIAVGFPTVMIGNAAGAPGGFGAGIVLTGTPAEQAQLAALLNGIRDSGPLGAAFVNRLETAATPTQFAIGTSATRADGTVIQLANTGGGITLRPTESASGNNEVHIDPTNLINYAGTDGAQHTETPQGLLLHEAGHADLLNSGDPAQTTGGPNAERNVRTLTNPIRTEGGMVPEA